MAKSKFTEVELERIRSIQERPGCSRKTAVKKLKQSQEAAKADVKKAAANDKPEAAPASTMTPEECARHGQRVFGSTSWQAVQARRISSHCSVPRALLGLGKHGPKP